MCSFSTIAPPVLVLLFVELKDLESVVVVQQVEARTFMRPKKYVKKYTW